MSRRVWTLTHCDCGKPAVAHASDNEKEYAHCAECFIPWHKEHAAQTRRIVARNLGRA